MVDDRRTLPCNKKQIILKNNLQKTKLDKGEYKLITLFKNVKTLSNMNEKNNQASSLQQGGRGNDTGITDKTVHMKKKIYPSKWQKASGIFKNKPDLFNWLNRVKDYDNNNISFQARSSLQDSDKSKSQDKAEFILRSSVHMKRRHPFHQKFAVNVFSEYNIPRSQTLYRNPLLQLLQQRWSIYRCEPISLDNMCCCTCTSEAMYEVMKGLYDCYMRKNCDDCDCILCGQYMVEIIDQSREGAGEKLNKEDEYKDITLKGKLPADKEKIFKDMARNGIPLPKGITASDREILRKVRADMGLPPAPTTAEDREKEKRAQETVQNDVGLPAEPPSAADEDKYRREMASRIITALEGKPPDLKEKILRAINAAGIPLPEGSTASEKSLIAKLKGLPPGPTSTQISHKLRQAKAAGLLTPLAGKTTVQKENILRGLALRGLPLPDDATSSEKKLIEKVRYDIGLPQKPKKSEDKRKYDNALASGLIIPLEGKTSEEKEKTLRAQQALGIPLPEGRTDSEKYLIEKVKELANLPIPTGLSIPIRKLKDAKAAGLLSSLQGKTHEQKENILQNIAMKGLPLPPGITDSEKNIINKVRNDVGLPPEPQSAADKEKYKKGIFLGVITPLEGKSQSQKEKILRGLVATGIPLPEGRTASEKALIAKITGEAQSPTTEKLRRAKVAGLLTPLTGKTPAQKQNILRGLAIQGLPLPEGSTYSEKNLIEKVRMDLGLPPKPKTPFEREKYNKALAAGIIAPLEGKTPEMKEKILRAQQSLGIPLLEGRTPSERAIVAKVKMLPVSFPPGISIPIDKLNKAKAAGLLTPLDGKSPVEKENIFRTIALAGLPLPPGKTPLEKNIINKVRHDIGLPPEPQSDADKNKYNKGISIGIVTPLEGKSLAQKEKILKALQAAGIQLPEGRTPSENDLIAKVAGDTNTRATERLRRAKAAGLLTPLTGKSPEHKEKIIRGLAMQGLPLPEGSTFSERNLIEKIRNNLGLPPKPKTPFEKNKYNKALAAGIITPLEGKTPEMKEKILRAQQSLGIPLLEGRTPSEKALVAKIKALPSLPFPSSEKELGIPPEAKTLFEKEIVKAANEKGLLTPLTGKTAEQKEKIIKGLAAAGLPIPEGKTSSEKELIKKVRQDVGLPPEPTPSEKLGKIRKKSKKIGAVGVKRSARGVGMAGALEGIVKPWKSARGVGLATGGITEELQDIVKTTTCDRSCGCEKKKIKFKHSYVKIKVTSPHLSTTCPCPDDCFPHPKPEIVTDNEGIKVTIGSAVGIPAFTKKIYEENSHFRQTYYADSDSNFNYQKKQTEKSTTTEASLLDHFIHSTNYVLKNNSYMTNSSNDDLTRSSNYFYNDAKNSEDTSNAQCAQLRNVHERRKRITDDCNPYLCDLPSSRSTTTNTSTGSSFKSIYILKNKSTDDFLSASDLGDATISIISFVGSIYSPNVSSDLSSSHDIFSNGSELSSTQFSSEVTGSLSSDHVTVLLTRKYITNRLRAFTENNAPIYSRDACSYNISQTRLPKKENSDKYNGTLNDNSILITRNFNTDYNKMDQLQLKKSVSGDSSIFLVISTSDESNSDHSLNDIDNPICMQVSQIGWVRTASKKDGSQPSTSKSEKKSKKVKKNKLFTSKSVTGKDRDAPRKSLQFEKDINATEYRVQRSVTLEHAKVYRAVSVDTMQDRPCCCTPRKVDIGNNQCSAIMSEIFSPLIMDQDEDGIIPDILKVSSEEVHQALTKLFTKCLIGLNQEEIESCRVTSKSVSTVQQTYFISKKQSPIRLSRCQIAPCNRPPKHLIDRHTDMPDFLQPMTDPYERFGGTCHPWNSGSSADKLLELIEQWGKDLQQNQKPSPCKEDFSCCSEPRKPDEKELQEIKNKLWKPGDPREQTCESCGRPVDGKVKCLCHGEDKLKKIRKQLCPCTAYTAPPVPDEEPKPPEGSGSEEPAKKICKCCICQGGKAKIGINCSCAQNTCYPDREPKQRCDCFTEPEPDVPIDFDILKDMIEERQRYEMLTGLKVISDNTQKVSGFNVRVRKKQLTEMSLEEAIKYFELHPDEVPEPIEETDDCVCEEEPKPKMKPKPAWRVRLSLFNKNREKCECPDDPPVPEPDEFYPLPTPKPRAGRGMGAAGGAGPPGSRPPGVPFSTELPVIEEPPPKGFKVVVGAKGSGSKGLKGICCFDLLQEQTFPNQSKPPPDLPE